MALYFWKWNIEYSKKKYVSKTYLTSVNYWLAIFLIVLFSSLRDGGTNL